MAMKIKFKTHRLVMTTKEMFKKRKYVLAVLVVLSYLIFMFSLFLFEVPTNNKDILLAGGGTLWALVVLAAKEYFDGVPDDTIVGQDKKKEDEEI